MQSDMILHNPALPRFDIDRWAYTLATGLFALTAVVGFAPRSAAILSGILPNPPLSVHVHAALMSLWLLLLVVQSALVAGRRRYLHATLGLGSLVLVPLILTSMVLATLDTYGLMQAAGAGMLGSSILLLQIRGVLLFSLFFWWGFRTRRSDRATHKRMMLLCTFVLMDAAIGRMNWLPFNDITVTINWAFLYHFVLLLPILAYDWLRFGRLHQVWVVGLALYLPFVLLTCALWLSPAWHAFASSLLGY